MFTRIQNEQGAALLITLAIMSLITFVVIMSLDRSTTDVELTYNQLHVEQSFYVADAGTKYTLAKLIEDPYWRGGFTDKSFGEGNFTVSITDSTGDPALYDTLIIMSVGTIEDATSAIELTTIPIPFKPFKYAMFADSDIDIKAMMETDSYNSDSGSYAATKDTLFGDIGSNGLIGVDMAASIGGDIVTSEAGGITVSPGATVYGVLDDDAPDRELVPIPQAEFDWAEANHSNMVGISGSYSYHPVTHAFNSSGTFTLSSGVYFFSSFNMMAASKLKVVPGDSVTIYITGNMELKNSSSINVGGKPANCVINSKGNMILKNSGDVYAAFYNPAGTVDLRNTGEFFGSIMADRVIAHNSSLFHFDRSLAKIERDEIEGFEKISWREVL
ncbi:MAG: hypothetical protein P1R58_12745 [bacterium]|nr:hypothetical protein [bacterium]